MTINYHIGDLEFSAASPADLKKELEEFFSGKGMVPGIELSGDGVTVTLDDGKVGPAAAKVNLAYECCNRGNFGKAKTLLSEALGICPLFSDAYRTLAQIHMQEGRSEDAVAACSDALKCDPGNLWALILMGNLMLNHRKDRQEALKYYERVLDFDPGNILAQNNVAGVKLGAGDFAGALERFDRVLKADPTYANAWFGKASCLDHLDRPEEAFEAARTGCREGKETPENPGTKRQLVSLMVSLARRIAQREDYMEDARRIKEEVEVSSGVPVELVPDGTLPVLAKLEYHFHHHTDRDIVRYNPGKPFTGHLLIHEMMHLKMSTRNTRAGTGRVVYSDADSEQRFRGRFSPVFRPLAARLGTARFEQFWHSLFSGLCTRTMNSPLDLFVENMIFEDYPRIRPVQLLSLLQQETDNMKADESASGMKDIPRTIVDATKVMNLVQTLQLKDLYGVDMTPGHHPRRPDMDLAKDLYEEYKAYKDTYEPGDEYELLEYFTDKLRLQDLLLIREEPAADAAPGPDLYEMRKPTDEEREREAQFQAANKDGEDPVQTMMLSFYMLAALQYMEGMSKLEIKRIAYESAMLGVGGIDPTRKGYTLASVPDRKFSGYEVLAWQYVSWSLSAPEAVDSLNLPFTAAWDQAVSMYDAKKKNK